MLPCWYVIGDVRDLMPTMLWRMLWRTLSITLWRMLCERECIPANAALSASGWNSLSSITALCLLGAWAHNTAESALVVNNHKEVIWGSGNVTYVSWWWSLVFQVRSLDAGISTNWVVPAALVPQSQGTQIICSINASRFIHSVMSCCITDVPYSVTTEGTNLRWYNVAPKKWPDKQNM